MYKYFTKRFYNGIDCPGKISDWLNSFIDPDKPYSEHQHEVIGYIAANGHIVITVKTFTAVHQVGIVEKIENIIKN